MKKKTKMKDRIRTKTTDSGDPRGNGGSPLLMTIATVLFCLMVGAVIGDVLKSICK